MNMRDTFFYKKFHDLQRKYKINILLNFTLKKNNKINGSGQTLPNWKNPINDDFIYILTLLIENENEICYKL